MITAKDWDKLKGSPKSEEITKHQLQLNLNNLHRKLKYKGHQKSANRDIYYARMNDGLVPYDNAEAAQAARHAEIKADIKSIELTLANIV
jgi:hypothetical protein